VTLSRSSKPLLIVRERWAKTAASLVCPRSLQKSFAIFGENNDDMLLLDASTALFMLLNF
jgi:hypothetical protein